jgi:cobalt-precorrin-5B (C1)-methyltransferase
VTRIRSKLRRGFSTGTAATAAARAALRHLLMGETSPWVAVRLPAGIFLPIPVSGSRMVEQSAWASVIKDGGDDPDVTHNAEIQATVRCVTTDHCISGICLVAGDGVGIVTKPGLPVPLGEPAVNPTPRSMLAVNLTEELLRWHEHGPAPVCPIGPQITPTKPHVSFSFTRTAPNLEGLMLEVELRVPRGLELARHTLNPRLGIIGGISILGTTGLVKPFSHDAYKETIQAALSVAASSGCKAVALSTGGKSERFARTILKDWPDEAFVQIADFYAFALDEVRRHGFEEVVLSVFFGKAVKMAQGHPYTHARTVPLDLGPVAGYAGEAGYHTALCHALAGANTAREALDLLLAHHAEDVLKTVAGEVLDQSLLMVGSSLAVRLLLFGYEGNLLFDLKGP